MHFGRNGREHATGTETTRGKWKLLGEWTKSSLRIEKKRKNELNDKKELEALATAIKEVYFRDYMTVYDDSHTEIDKPQFDYII